MNFVPKNAIESHRNSRDQHGFVGRQFTSGIGGIEGPNIVRELRNLEGEIIFDGLRSQKAPELHGTNTRD